MAKFAVPEGYEPYRLFTFQDEGSGLEVVLRPEQFVGAVKGKSGPDRWSVEVGTKDGSDLTVHLSTESRCRQFIAALVAFLEQDALRNTHNAVMRKGKSNE